ncbi:MAG: insulinase family protein, partial [Myxococcota bacterium]
MLDNGLEVRLRPNHDHPRVGVCLTYRVGSRDDPRGYRGLAHLVEHLMFQGSRNIPEDAFFDYLQSAGGNGNGTTGGDRSTYSAVLPAGRLNLALWLESDRMAYLLDHLDQETLDQQRAVVRREWEERHGSRPTYRAAQFVREALYPEGHPYRSLHQGPDDLD